MIGIIIEAVSSVAGKYFDSEEKKTEFEMAVQTKLLENEGAIAEAQSNMWAADSGSESAITRTWRPITALTMLVLVVYLVIVAPLFTPETVELIYGAIERIPTQVWALVMIAWGVPAAGRSLEKFGKNIRGRR